MARAVARRVEMRCDDWNLNLGTGAVPLGKSWFNVDWYEREREFAQGRSLSPDSSMPPRNSGSKQKWCNFLSKL